MACSDAISFLRLQLNYEIKSRILWDSVTESGIPLQNGKN